MEIDKYISKYPEKTQDILKRIRTIAHEEVPGGQESISYGIPCLKLNGKFVVYFAGYKNHVSLYPIPPAPKSFEKKIAPFIKGKGTVQFQIKDPIPYDLIREFVKYSLKAHKERLSSK